MTSVSERRAALDERFPHWQPRTLDQVLADAAHRYPDRPFVIADDRDWTYAEVDDRAALLAGGLISAGLKPGEHVAIVMANYADFVCLKFAIARAGAVAVPVNFLNRRDELRYVLGQSDSVMLITMDRFRDLDYLAMLDDICPDWEHEAGGESLPTLRKVFVYHTADHTERAVPDFRTLLDAHAQRNTVGDADPHCMSDIIYTSGTTGGPKGVMLTHDMVLRTAFGSAYARAYEDGRRLHFSLPLYHVYGYVEGLLSTLFVGGCVVVDRVFDPAGTLRAIARHRVNDLLLVPTMTLALIEVLGSATPDAPYDLSSLRYVLSSGGKAPPGIWEEIRHWLGVSEITTGYGMSEASGSTTVTEPDDEAQRLLTTNGRLRNAGAAGDSALAGKLVDYKVVDTRTGTTLPHGQIGELMMRGPGVTSGYYRKPADTAAAFDDSGWMRSGDLGCIDEQGYLSLKGRTKESYRCGGEQVLPLEVENVLCEHPDVAQAHVVPVPDTRMGEAGAAFIVMRPNTQVAPQALQQLCAERLARFKVPKHILFITDTELPTTATGRPRKFMLVERAIKELRLA